MFQSPPWQSLKRDPDSLSGTGKELSHGTTTGPSRGTNNSQSLPPNKDAAPTSTQSTATALTGVVPCGDGSTVTKAAKAQHAKQPNAQKTAAASSLTKAGAGNKPVAKVTTRTLDATGSAKRLATSGEIGAKGQCNAKPVGTKLQRAPGAVTNPVQNTQENTATTSNSTPPTKSRVSTQSATKSNAKTSVVKACPNSVNAAVGARLAAAPTVRPANTGAMSTTTKVTDSKQSTIGVGSKSVETSKGSMKVKSNTKLTAAATPAVTAVTKATSGTNVTKPVTTSVRVKTSTTAMTTIITPKQVSPKATAKTVGATKTITTTNQSDGTATKKPAAKAKPTTTKGSGKPASVHQPASSKPTTTMPSSAQLEAHKVTPVRSTAVVKTGASSSMTTTNKPAMVVTCQTTTTTVTTKTPSRTKSTSSAPSAASSVKQSTTSTGTNNANPTTNSGSAKIEPNRGGVHRTLSARDADTSQMINPHAAATTCTQAVVENKAQIRKKDTVNQNVDGAKSSKKGGDGWVMSPTVAQSQLEVTQSIDVAMVMPSSSTLSLSDRTRCDKVVSSTATIHRNDAVSSAMPKKALQPVDDLEKEVIYSEEQTVSMAMVTTKSDMVDMPSGDTVQEDNNRSSLLSDRLEAVPLSPVSDTLLLLIIFNNSSSSIYFGAY